MSPYYVYYFDSSGAITLVFVLAAIFSVFFGYRMRIELLAIPVSTLFAFPQLRGSMPGAPLGGETILFWRTSDLIYHHFILGTIVGELVGASSIGVLLSELSFPQITWEFSLVSP